MTESPRIGAGLRLPWGLAGMIALVVLAEGFVSRRSLELLDADDWAYRLSARAASRDARRYDVLCFGDSLTKLEIVPRAVSERSGLRAYNLAVSGSQPASSLALLRRVLDSGARPSAVVVDFFPPLLRLGPRHNLGRWANVLGPVEMLRLAWSARDGGLFAVPLLGRVFPSVQRRDAIRDAVRAALTGGLNMRPWFNTMLRRNWSCNGGAHLIPPSPGIATLTDRQLDEFRAGFYPEWSCHPANVAAVDSFLSLAAARGVPVFWVFPPLLPALQSRLDATGFEARHEQFAWSFQARYPNLTVLDGRGAVTDPAGFFDANHLSAQGAYAYSLALGDALRKTLHAPPSTRPRWVSLPHVKPRPLPDGLEDTDQTTLALKAGATRR
jgi:hypothetical protein